MRVGTKVLGNVIVQVEPSGHFTGKRNTRELSCYSRRTMKFKLDYEKMLVLDAEDLAEAGIKRAYESARTVLSQYRSEPVEIQEVVDNDAPSYAVRCGDREYVIYAPAL